MCTATLSEMQNTVVPSQVCAQVLEYTPKNSSGIGSTLIKTERISLLSGSSTSLAAIKTLVTLESNDTYSQLSLFGSQKCTNQSSTPKSHITPRCLPEWGGKHFSKQPLHHKVWHTPKLVQILTARDSKLISNCTNASQHHTLQGCCSFIEPWNIYSPPPSVKMATRQPLQTQTHLH